MPTALFNFFPYHCPKCGTTFKRDELNYQDFIAGASCTCKSCGLHYACANNEALMAAANASESDLSRYVTTEDL